VSKAKKTAGKATPEAEAAAVWVQHSTLTPWSKNPRKNDGLPAESVAKSIKRFGWGAPIIARNEGREVVAGHTRLKAVQILLGWWEKATDRERATWHPDAVRTVERGEVPCRFGDWSDHDAHVLALADNRLNEKAEWDLPVLQDVMSELGLEDVELAGWSSEDLDAMGADLDPGNDDGEDGGGDDSQLGDMKYSVVVHCADEAEQDMITQKLENQGLQCRPVISK